MIDRRAVQKSKQLQHYEHTKDGFIHQYTYVNDVPLNSEHCDIKVNVLIYRQIDPSGKQKDKVFSWITDFKLTKASLYFIMRIGRSRWKIENETFNTLKNQHYHFKHNFGHGKQFLSSVLVLLMMLAFLVDQIQQFTNPLFQKALKKEQSRIALWQAVRSKFNEFIVQSMEMIYLLIIGQIKVRYEYYQDSS